MAESWLFIPNLGEINKLNAMLEMTKKILTNVSFDAYLFQKELYKALKWITNSEEFYLFREWCMREFGRKYPHILQKAFALSK
jgi:hypothetical protein